MSYLLLLSPAKKQAQLCPEFAYRVTQPRFQVKTSALVEALKKLTPSELSMRLKISEKLGELNAERYSVFNTQEHTSGNAHPALFVFQGDAYRALDPMSFDSECVRFIQGHLRILSGLYGLLRPLDLIQYHRLEMGSSFSLRDGEKLLDYWGEDITRVLKKDLGSQGVVVNVASNEYSQVVNQSSFANRWVDIVFRQKRGSTVKSIGILAKRARGAFVRYAAEQKCGSHEQLKEFSVDGYCFMPKESSSNRWVFETKEL